jgi:hypothetical protein
MKKDGLERVAIGLPQTIEEGAMRDIAIMAQEAKNFNQFVKNFFKEFTEIPKNKEALKWLEDTYKSVSESINELVDETDTITMDVPLFIRALEYAKEDAKTDMDLHKLAQKSIQLSKEEDVLTMDDYDFIVGESLTEAPVKIIKTITRKEWNKKHKDFKLMGRDGIPYIMAYDDKIGTHLVPVKIVDESVTEGVSQKDMESIKGAVQSASSFMNIGSELKKLGMKYIFATSPMPIYVVQDKGGNRVGIVNKKYATKPDFVHGDTAVGVMENIKLNSVNEDENPCWKGYQQIGMKTKNGKEVPNCVPKNESIKLTNILKEWRAEDVLQQLGGRKFIAMTGAKNFVKNDKDKSITFKIPKAKGGITHINIQLTSSDLYNVRFISIRGVDMKIVKMVKGVYNDQLQSIFTQYTGLNTSL